MQIPRNAPVIGMREISGDGSTTQILEVFRSHQILILMMELTAEPIYISITIWMHHEIRHPKKRAELNTLRGSEISARFFDPSRTYSCFYQAGR